ncbi:MAG TPA: hypothetical protein DCP28_36145, partial [Cytophagales bacterium]|nr:hypothetical protein [Cytophagales bacterium]
QDGLYVPPNALLALAFDTEWSDAHAEREEAVDYVMERALALLRAGGDVWIAEAGQSDFSAAVVRIIQAKAPGIDTKERVHVVQHSDWNEQVTTPEDLQFVQQQTDYHKIPDGNAVGNGTPGFRDPEFTGWQEYMPDEGLAEVWQLAIDLGNQYNGKDGRYNNEAVAAGGLDFSDFAEVCWILGIELEDTRGFFETFGR